MCFHSKVLVILVCLSVLIPGSVFSQEIIYFENFEKGLGTQIDKIKRYPMNPEVISSDPIYPNAFPPPSGKYAVRACDKDHSYYGLGSVVGGPVIDLNNPSHHYTSIEAKLYLVDSPGQADIANNALIAVDDFDKTEQYYRFGYARNSIYFHFFDRVDFTESLYDPETAGKLQIPGWHTFTMRFNGPNKIHFYVDNEEVFFSPVQQGNVTRFRMGVLGWDRYEFRPIIADDFKVMLYSEPPLTKSSAPPPGPLSQPQNIFSPVQQAQPAQPAQPVSWYVDPNQAVQAARQSGKMFLVFFYLPGHPKTRQLEMNTLSKPSVQATIGKFIPLRLDGTRYKEVAKLYNIFKYPTLIIIDMNGNIYWEYKGIITTENMNRSLARF